MRKASAITAVCFGVVAITFAIASYLHLRSLATATPPVDISEYLDFPILSIGMVDPSTPAIIDAATFARSLTYRIYTIAASGLALLFIGACLFRVRGREVT